MPKKIAHEDAEAVMLALIGSKSLAVTAPTSNLCLLKFTSLRATKRKRVGER